MLPILFSIGPIEIHTGSVLLAIAGIISLVIFLKKVHLKRLPVEFLVNHYMVLLVVSIMGARLTHLILNWEQFRTMHEENTLLATIAIWDKGLSLMGGFIAFIISFMLLIFLKKENLWQWLSAIITPTLIIFLFKHLSDFFEGQAYGKATSLRWGIIFEGSNVKYTVPIHPTQIYAAIYTLSIMAFLQFYKPIQQLESKNSGFTFIFGSGIYAFFTFLNGFFRGDDIIMIWFLRIDQVIGLIIFLLAGMSIKKSMTRKSL
ncbi:prolipoprotein diacylglyceryl transferase [Candidatus Peregrinibacteria bacterium]|nr:prolipoprotein diacylglyceryl transferase [Candidatus Peregrinibacteria bacterium]